LPEKNIFFIFGIYVELESFQSTCRPHKNVSDVGLTLLQLHGMQVYKLLLLA